MEDDEVKVGVEKGHTVRKTTNRGIIGTVYNLSLDGWEAKVGWGCGHTQWEPTSCLEVQVREGRKLVWRQGTNTL